jgi:hypothetical protein
MRQDRKHGFTCGALDPPDGEPTQPDPDVMRVAGQTPAPATGRRVGELKAQGQDKGEDELDKCLAVVQQAKVGRFVSKIDGDGPVFVSPFGCLAGLDHGVGHFRLLSITQQRHLLAYHFIAMRHEGLCQVF